MVPTHVSRFLPLGHTGKRRLSCMANICSFCEGSLGDNAAQTVDRSHLKSGDDRPVTPLQRFVDAKARINSIYVEIENYIRETTKSLEELSEPNELFDPSLLTSIHEFCDSIHQIRDVLMRDHMKVVFFGRTSNGKSSVINAMLHAKVLPSGIGHTTRCFLQVEGSTDDERYMLTEGSNEPKNLSSIDHLAHALCSQDLGEDVMIRVFWPSNTSRLLQNEVILVDSPGVDVSPQFDSWIDKHCLDADVFVLVSNAESTLTQAEKNFFLRVNAKLSKPNVFILNNRWDASASEPDYIEQVRQQHMTRFLKFLVDELQVCSEEEAFNRVFFVSAKEALMHRLAEQGIMTIEGCQTRLKEFEAFEHQFELCISDSAIRTKFEFHIQKGRDVSRSICRIFSDLYRKASERSERLSGICKNKISELKTSQTKVLSYMENVSRACNSLTVEVQRKVMTEIVDEVHRLEALTDNYQQPFYDDPVYLGSYKRDLINYLDSAINNDLMVRCSGGLLEGILLMERDIVRGAMAMFPPEVSNKAISVLQYRQPFRFSFSLGCASLLQDFQEDLEFRFSLGMTQLIRWFLRIRKNGSRSEKLFGGYNVIPEGISPDTPSDGTETTDVCATENVLMNSIVYTSASYVANGSVGVLLIGGLIYRAVGWRLIFSGAALYFLFYAYERMSWNSRAKENCLKKQLREHLAKKLKQISPTLSTNCKTQVQRERASLICSQLDDFSDTYLKSGAI
ncbi:unnamed protein product [Soboliphyme baturini]|uniref:Dynamin-type G domain-containing protein n=1 Tax=Soboliphyme baturini TaxID=241478 RepID=A0A183INS9_9BILA|nr:unnamed protein product [Soboliphyme baturini]